MPTTTQLPTPESAVRASSANLRAGPGTNYDVVMVLNRGEVLKVTGRLADGSWLEVETSSGRVGWVALSVIDLDSSIDIIPIERNIPPTPIWTATVIPTPSVNFNADADSVSVGQCTMLRWKVENAQAIFLYGGEYGDPPGLMITGHEALSACPQPPATVYTLHVITLSITTRLRMKTRLHL